MSKQDVLFAQRKFSQNYPITRLEGVAKMNSHSSKRKREVEQSLIPKSTPSVYEGLSMGVLTAPITTRDFVEVEPPTKRFQAGTDKTVLQNTFVNSTVDRGLLSGATPLLTDEQFQQFINSTVIPQNCTTVKAGSASSNSSWSQCKATGRPTQQNIPTNVNQPYAWIPATANTVLLQNKVPQLPSQQPVQPFAISSGQTQQYLHMHPVSMDYSVLQHTIQTTAMGGHMHHNNGTTGGQKRSIYDQTKNRNGKTKIADVQQYKHQLSVDRMNQQRAVPIIPNSTRVLKKACRQSNRAQQQGLPTANSKQPKAELASISYLSNNLLQNYPQTSKSDLVHKAWSFAPQPVPSYVKPAEARTKSEKFQNPLSKNVSQQLTEVARNGYKKGAKKVKLDTASINHSIDSQQRETTLSQTDESSTRHGKKNTELGFAPPKPVEYPPYVHRIMRILSRAELRSQTETKKENDIALSKQSSKECGETLPKKCSPPTAVECSDKITEKQYTSKFRATESMEASTKKCHQHLTASEKPASKTPAAMYTGRVDKITEKCSEQPTECSQRCTQNCNTISQKCRQVKATKCNAEKCSKNTSEKLIHTAGHKKQRTKSKVTKILPNENKTPKLEVDQLE